MQCVVVVSCGALTEGADLSKKQDFFKEAGVQFVLIIHPHFFPEVSSVFSNSRVAK